MGVKFKNYLHRGVWGIQDILDICILIDEYIKDYEYMDKLVREHNKTFRCV